MAKSMAVMLWQDAWKASQNRIANEPTKRVIDRCVRLGLSRD
jgi:hypothetical protein